MAADQPSTAARAVFAIERELWKVQARLEARVDEDNDRYLYGAQQALEWALGNRVMPPSKAFEGVSHAN